MFLNLFHHHLEMSGWKHPFPKGVLQQQGYAADKCFFALGTLHNIPIDRDRQLATNW